jgi:hypothetical protein
MGDTRLDERKFGMFKRASASRPAPKHIYKPESSLNDILFSSKSRDGRSLSNDRAVIWRMSVWAMKDSSRMKRIAIAATLVIAALFGVGPMAQAQTAPPQATLVPPDFSACNFTVPTTFAHVWYFDPVHGPTENTYTAAGVSLNPTVTPHQGDITHPWKDLNAVATSAFNSKVTIGGYNLPLLGSPIQPGDELLLQSGTAAQYGVITFGISGVLLNPNGAFITVKPAPGATATLAELLVVNVDNFAFSGINFQSTGAGTGQLMRISPGLGKNIVFDSMNVSTVDAATAQTWTQAQWAAAPTGVDFTVGPCVSLTNSHIFNVGTGVQFSGGTQIKFQNNEIDHVSEDAMDFDGVDLSITGNYVHDFPNAGAGDHIDAMQGVLGLPSAPQNNRIAINDNTILWQVDPNLPFPTGSFVNGAIDWGSCCWNNMQVNNNKIYWPNFIHGISSDHCINCIVENNSLAGGFIVFNGGDVGVTIKNNLVSGLDCKGGDQVGVTMQNNILYKGGNGINLVCFGGSVVQLPGAPRIYLGNNLIDNCGVLGEITAFDLTTLTYDFHLLGTAQARGAGAAVDFSPQVDSLGLPLNSPPDVGAVAYPNNTTRPQASVCGRNSPRRFKPTFAR